jgi:hypothetical protein
MPCSGEPGYATYRHLHELVHKVGATPQDVLAGPEVNRRMDEAAGQWGTHHRRTQNAVMVAVMRGGVDVETTPDVPLSLMRGWVNDYLRRTSTGTT